MHDQVAKEFEVYRQPDAFNEDSLVIENSNGEHSTLLVQVDRKDVVPC
ncbi:hypothetical protein ACFQH2_06500 [Natronoarchaeum sp. GCM10025703]